MPTQRAQVLTWVCVPGASSLGSGAKACDIKTMSDRYQCHVPERAKTVRPLAALAGRPKLAKSVSRRGARQAERDSRDGKPREIGGPSGPEPTRYGDWEINGRCVDF
jgi:hypothetical protein